MHSVIIRFIAVILTCGAFYSTTVASARKITVGAVLFPEHGHFGPLTSVIQASVDRGDDVLVFTPDFFIPKPGADFGPRNVTPEIAAASKGTKVSTGSVRYVGLGEFHFDPYDDGFFLRLVELPAFESLGEVNAAMVPLLDFFARRLKSHFDKVPEDIPDVFIIDYGSNSATFVAEYLKVPAVLSWPMTLAFPFSTNYFVPFMSLGISANPTLFYRAINIFVYIVARFKGARDLAHPNMLRAELGLPPMDVYHLLGRNPVITPSVYGFDVTQPMCPNVFSVGMLLPTLTGEMDESYTTFLSTCKRLVYINMGSIAVLPRRWDGAVMNFSVRMANKGTCVIWKRRAMEYPALKFDSPAAESRFIMTKSLPFSPRHILNTNISKVFVTHCGDTSVYESIEAHCPMVGIPLFADQPDVCARIKDSHVGTFVKKEELTADLLEQSVEETFTNQEVIIERLTYMHSSAKVQGLAPRAAEVLHLIADLGYEGSKALNCKNIDEPWYRIYDVDVMVGVSVAAWSVLLIFYYSLKVCFRCMCGSRSKKSLNNKKAKLD